MTITEQELVKALRADQVARLEANALAAGYTVEGWLRLSIAWMMPTAPEPRPKPLKSAYGILAKYGPGPSAKEIDENRREMFRSFGEEL